jgi:hypothetical protein
VLAIIRKIDLDPGPDSLMLTHLFWRQVEMRHCQKPITETCHTVTVDQSADRLIYWRVNLQYIEVWRLCRVASVGAPVMLIVNAKSKIRAGKMRTKTVTTMTVPANVILDP